uniref:Uncharacterized protein n=1 Tax=Globodera rostochiensis TaxID=31243 RepID=A0A914H8J7_GLORO
MKAKLKQDEFEKSYKEINETVAKELGITDRTIYRWKRKLGQTEPNKYPHFEQKEMMKSKTGFGVEEEGGAFGRRLRTQIPAGSEDRRLFFAQKFFRAKERWKDGNGHFSCGSDGQLVGALSINDELDKERWWLDSGDGQDEWWDKDEAEDLKTPVPTNFGQNVHHQIDRQNTQIGQIEPNSTDQLGQIEPNSTNQNPPLTEWKNELCQTEPKKSHSEQKELMKLYYEIKGTNPKIRDEGIAKNSGN